MSRAVVLEMVLTCRGGARQSRPEGVCPDMDDDVADVDQRQSLLAGSGDRLSVQFSTDLLLMLGPTPVSQDAGNDDGHGAVSHGRSWRRLGDARTSTGDDVRPGHALTYPVELMVSPVLSVRHQRVDSTSRPQHSAATAPIAATRAPGSTSLLDRVVVELVRAQPWGTDDNRHRWTVTTGRTAARTDRPFPQAGRTGVGHNRTVGRSGSAVRIHACPRCGRGDLRRRDE